MRCVKCGQENPSEALFCMKCGTKLERKCPQCGAEYPEEALFCMKCGTKLDIGARHAVSASRVAESEEAKEDEAVPKLEDMQDRLYIPEPLRQRMDAAEQEMAGENRLVTALFADISGFTSMSQELSPEATVEKVNQCFQAITDAVYRYEGSVNRFIGDCVLTFFGAPLVHENDTERAIRAALDMREAVSRLGLNISVGINTGMTYFGTIGTQKHLEFSAYGHDVNLAKRLQETADPGQILIGAGAYRLTRRAFNLNQLGDVMLRGIGSPVQVYEVLGIREHPEKLRGIEGLRARMIGREHEFAELKEATDAWLDGQGQIVSIIGEAGIGKSRLVRELRSYLGERGGEGARENMSILEGRCVSIGQPISYWPFRDILRTYFGLSEEDDPISKARKVTEATTNLFPQSAEEALPFLGNLLSIRLGNELDDRLKFATPEQIRHQTLMRLRDFFEAVAQASLPVGPAKKRPLLLILEDLHWADDLSLDLISLLMDSLPTTPLMMLCIYRPERDHRVWQLSSQAQRKCLDRYTEITLNPLSSRESRQLVETLLTIENLPESVKDMILRKSEGNPFFIEEVIRSLIEQDLVYREDDRWKAREEISDINVPDTIQSVLLARVDRLQAEAKYVLQCASVIGRLFRYRLLEHLAEQEQNLDRYLSEFEERELVYEERTVPELEYAFKHALTQEATYQSILERHRREFHHQVAIGIERLYQERLDEYYEELAYHYSRAITTGRDAPAIAEKAMEYLLKAGGKAKNSYASEVAISHFNEALGIMEQTGVERKDWDLQALRGLGEIYLGIGETVEAEKAFGAAIALAKEMELPPRQLTKLYHWISEALWWQSRFDEVIRYGEVGLEILGDDKECMEAALMNSRIAVGNFSKGNQEKWRESTHKNMEFIKKLKYSAELRAPYVHIVIVTSDVDMDPEIAWEWAKELETRAEQHHDLRAAAEARHYQAGILESKGDYKNALPLEQKSLDMFQSIGDAKLMSWCYGRIARVLLNSGDIREAETPAQASLSVTKQVGNPRDIAGVHNLSGSIAMGQRCWEDALSHYQKALEGKQAIGNPSAIAHVCLLLGRAHLKKGDYHQAIRFFEEAGSANDLAALAGMEEAYMALGMPEKFVEFCRSSKELDAEMQWYPEPTKPSEEFTHLAFSDDFDTPAATQCRDFETGKTYPSQAGMPVPPWDWVDEFGDCAYRVVDAGGLEICAANGRNLYHLNLSAPRVMREFCGDFAIEVYISVGQASLPVQSSKMPSQPKDSLLDNEKPQIGGLLVWKDKDNFLRFDKGVYGYHEVRLHGYVGGKWKVAGRGLLPVGRDGIEQPRGYRDTERHGEEQSNSPLSSLCASVPPCFSSEVHLRLERVGEQFSAYCSVDGQNWLACGKMTLPLDDPIQVGIHAIGMIDRTIYCDSFKDGTATLFRRFRVWTR